MEPKRREQRVAERVGKKEQIGGGPKDKGKKSTKEGVGEREVKRRRE